MTEIWWTIFLAYDGNAFWDAYLQFFFSVSMIHFPLTELDMQDAVTLSDGVLPITGELQIHSQSLNTEKCYYHWKLSLKIR